MHGDRDWLWVMPNPEGAHFETQQNRTKLAPAHLIGDWTGILVSDGYRVYQYWEGLRQSCLAHLIRAAKGLAESVEASIARFGCRIHTELQRLCHMSIEWSTVGQWRAWYARFSHRLRQHTAQENKVGVFARQ